MVHGGTEVGGDMDVGTPTHRVERIHALALHRANKFLTDRNRRVFERAGGLLGFSRIILGADMDSYCQSAAAELKTPNLHQIITFADAAYPRFLKEIDHAPFALYTKGKQNLLSRPTVSIVGTREPSALGRIAAASLARHFVQEGYVIVSGIARGIDSIAHHAALKAGGATIAVLPNGFNHLYPLENRDIYVAAGDNPHLLLISEYEPHAKPQKHHFVRRNRIIAGLSHLTVFVEGGLKSGGMITVNHALNYGREVAALSHIDLTQNSGGERLIEEGALNLSSIAFADYNLRVFAAPASPNFCP